jgi:putative flavoprotein involved in K+ transport
MNTLPGLPYAGDESDGFWRGSDLVDYFCRFVSHFQLPVRTGVEVISLEQTRPDGCFTVTTHSDKQAHELITCRTVIIANGSQQLPRIPPLSATVPTHITQLHTAGYRNPAALPPGAVVIVGSGQSGVQIAEDLLAAGRRVYLCTSKVGRVPRRYRGRDILEWWTDMKFMDVTFASLDDPSITRLAQPQASGVGRYGHTVSLQWLARQGAVILGRLLDVESGVLLLGDDAPANIHFADAFSQRNKDGIDAYIQKASLPLPPLEDDPADVPDLLAACASPLHQLDLTAAGVSTIIWTTGFTSSYDWIHLPVLDASGKPLHTRGISPVPGIYFLGLLWQHSRKSSIIAGVADDAQYVTQAVEMQLDSPGNSAPGQ